MAHIFCELLLRLQIVGCAAEDKFEFPLTQEELGDTLGVSTVHVNRVLQELRANGLITPKNNTLTVHDVAGLHEFSEFNPNYLHLKKRTRGAHETMVPKAANDRKRLAL